MKRKRNHEIHEMILRSQKNNKPTLPQFEIEKATDKTSESEFLSESGGGEDEEDENSNSNDEALRKSFNFNFIFDLFRAAMDGKNGDKNGNSSVGRKVVSSGPRDSDYVMLVMNQKQKENDEVAMLIDRLRANGVTCVFFSRNDLRNGSIKPPELPELSGNKLIKSHPLIQPPLDIMSPPLLSSSSSSTVQKNCNGLLTNNIQSNKVNNVLIPIPIVSPNGGSNITLLQSQVQQPPLSSSSSSPKSPPLLSPQCFPQSQPSKSKTNAYNNQQIESLEKEKEELEEDNNEKVDLDLSSSITSMSTTTKTKTKSASTSKRRRRKKYPYFNRKPVKRKNIWKELVKIGSPLSHEKEEELVIKSTKNIIPKSSIVLRTPLERCPKDPYAFTPEEEDFDFDFDFDPPPRLESTGPKKRRKMGNGLTKEPLLYKEKAAVLANVFGHFSTSSLSPKEKVSNLNSKLQEEEDDDERRDCLSPDIIKTPKKTTGPSPKKARKSGTGGSGGGGRGRKRKRKSPAVVKVKANKVQKLSNDSLLCVQPLISSTEEKGETGFIKEGQLSESVLLSSSTIEEDVKLQDKDKVSAGFNKKEEEINTSEDNNGNVSSDFLAFLGLQPSNSLKDVKQDSSPTPTASSSSSSNSTNHVEIPSQAQSSASSSELSKTKVAVEEEEEGKTDPIKLPHEFLLPAPPGPAKESSGLSNSILSSDSEPTSTLRELRRPSFYSLIAGNVRNNMENFLDGKMPQNPGKNGKSNRRRKRIKNGFLLNHGDNFPEDPEAPYKLHLATQILLKLNKRRAKFKPKDDKGKSLLSYLKLVPVKRASRGGGPGGGSSNGRNSSDASNAGANAISSGEAGSSGTQIVEREPSSVFSGDWTQERKHICNVCGHVEIDFWDMVMHKGEIHPGVVVTHVELPNDPPEGFRVPPPVPNTSALPPPPSCTKCETSFSTYSDLHRHIFECAGNLAWLEEPKPPRKKKSTRKKGFKRRLSNNTPKKKLDGSPVKRRYSEVFKCEFCTREFKTEGWLKNHLATHSLPISIPLNKLTLPPPPPNRASTLMTTSTRRSYIHNLIVNAAKT